MINLGRLVNQSTSKTGTRRTISETFTTLIRKETSGRAQTSTHMILGVLLRLLHSSSRVLSHHHLITNTISHGRPGSQSTLRIGTKKMTSATSITQTRRGTSGPHLISILTIPEAWLRSNHSNKMDFNQLLPTGSTILSGRQESH